MKAPSTISATYVWAAPLAIAYTAWSVHRSYLFTGDKIDKIDEIAQSNDFWFIPKYSNGTIFREASDALKGAYEGFYLPDHLLPNRLHIYICTICGSLVISNLYSRSFYHKQLGWIFVYLYAVNQLIMAYVLFYIGMLPLGYWVVKLDKLCWIVMMISCPLGIKFAREKKFAMHRVCMIWCAAGLFAVPNIRTFHFLINKIQGADLLDGTVGRYFATLDQAAILSFFSSFGTAALYTLPLPTNSKKIKKTK